MLNVLLLAGCITGGFILVVVFERMLYSPGGPELIKLILRFLSHIKKSNDLFSETIKRSLSRNMSHSENVTKGDTCIKSKFTPVVVFINSGLQ